MYNIYDSHDEDMTEDAKMRFIFKNSQHFGFDSTMEVMKAKNANKITNTLSYIIVSNHISTAVSQLLDYLSMNRNISSIQNNQDNNDTNSIYKRDGSISTDYHDNWTKLSVDNRKIVNDERFRIKLGRHEKDRSCTTGRSNSGSTTAFCN